MSKKIFLILKEIESLSSEDKTEILRLLILNNPKTLSAVKKSLNFEIIKIGFITILLIGGSFFLLRYIRRNYRITFTLQNNF